MRDDLITPLWLLGWALLGLFLLTLFVRRGWLLRTFSAAVLALWWCMSAPVPAGLTLGHLEHVARREAAACEPPPAGSMFIVLAGGVREPGHANDPVVYLSAASLRRTLAAERIASRVPSSILLFSGAHGAPMTEADRMRELALRLGFPATRILTDSVSLTTYESALNLTRRLGSNPGRPLYLITSAYHMARAYLAFRSAGLTVCALPVDFEAPGAPDARDWVPSMGGLAMMGRALHEYVGIPYYWLKFTRKDW